MFPGLETNPDTGLLILTYVVECVFRCLAALGNPTSSAPERLKSIKDSELKRLIPLLTGLLKTVVLYWLVLL